MPYRKQCPWLTDIEDIKVERMIFESVRATWHGRCPNLDKFGYVIHISSGLDPELLPVIEKKFAGVPDNPANVKRVKYFIASGTMDFGIISAKFFAEERKRRGYKAALYVSNNGTHAWPGFRRYFAEFAQVAFR
jgi:hypothetical protein